MSGLLWPGAERAGDVFTDAAVLAAMVSVENGWLATLAEAGIAPVAVDLTSLVDAGDVDAVAAGTESGGNPVIPLSALLRDRLRARGDDDAATWLHRGLTSQDILDTALVLEARRAAEQLAPLLTATIDRLGDLAGRHRATPMTGRTLTQPAVPIRFGAKVATWLHGILDATEALERLAFPVQAGGATGTLSGATVLTQGDGEGALALTSALASRLGLGGRPPWHTERACVTRIGSAFTEVTAACGRIANDVLTLSRPEIGELSEGVGGGSSTMPQKANPVLSTLIRRAALGAPADLALLHLAAADTGDERPAGAWHVEWQPLQRLARHAITAAAQTLDLVSELEVRSDRMAANLAAADGVHAERQTLGALVGGLADEVWAGADDLIIDQALSRAEDRDRKVSR